MRYYFNSMFLISILLLVWGCNQPNNRVEVDVSDIDIGDMLIKRYGKTIFSLDTGNLQQELKDIKPDYPLFLGGDLDDPGTINKMRDFITDRLLVDANKDCQRVFQDLYGLEEELENAFKHYSYYYPEQEIPDVYTYVSGFDYEFRIQFYNNNLLIALDMYLGSDYPVYQKLGVPQYVLHKFQSKYIIRDCMYEIGKTTVMYRKLGNNLIDFMINEGKLLWFVRALMPDLDEEILFDYNASQLEWIRQNEGLVWAFMIENEALYSTETDYKQKLIMDGPFTSYFGNDSPPRLGSYVGYKIVDNFMQKNAEIGLDMLMLEYDTKKILRLSKYKPDY